MLNRRMGINSRSHSDDNTSTKSSSMVWKTPDANAWTVVKYSKQYELYCDFYFDIRMCTCGDIVDNQQKYVLSYIHISFTEIVNLNFITILLQIISFERVLSHFKKNHYCLYYIFLYTRSRIQSNHLQVNITISK